MNKSEISMLMSILEKNLQATKNQDDLSDESEEIVKPKVLGLCPSKTPTPSKIKDWGSAPVKPRPQAELGETDETVEESFTKTSSSAKSNFSHQKFCIKCGSADNLFRTNKYKTCVQCCSKNTRPPPSDKQKANFQKARDVRMANIQKRKDALREFEESAKNTMDSKIVKKAVSVKKRQILRESQLDEVSDDDTPLEQVVEVAKKTAIRKSRKSIPNKIIEVEEEEQEEQPLELCPSKTPTPSGIGQYQQFSFL